MNRIDSLVDWCCTGVASFCAITQTNEAFQLVSIIIAIICGAITVIKELIKFVNFIMKWVREIKMDGKITPEELLEFCDATQEYLKEKENEINRANQRKSERDS